MISVEDAKQFATKNFPKAPEMLVELLGVVVRTSPMQGCDGWCLTTDDRAIIRINSNLVASRQRFTLAHELGHLILGIPTVVGESYEDMLRSNSAEEKRVNELASELLLPIDKVRNELPELPIVAKELKKLASKANVSEQAAAIRVCNLVDELGLVSASVVLFQSNDVLKWHWSKTLSISLDDALELLQGARSSHPTAFRVEQPNGVVVASILENPTNESTTMFVQLLPNELGNRLSSHEKRTQLEAILFKDNEALQKSMAGYMGALKNRIVGKSREEVEKDFWNRYSDILKNTAFNSEDGREYVRLRIAEWM